jgi:hypothetical protein
MGCSLLRTSAERLQLLELVERADDVNRPTSEVDGHRPRALADHTTNAVGVVCDTVVKSKLLDDRLGFSREGTTGEVSSLGR